MESEISRRSFIKVSAIAGSGMLLSFTFLNTNEQKEELDEISYNLNAYIKISSDNTITIMAPNPEIGQGVKTSLPLIIAEELCVDLETIKVEIAPLDNVYGSQVAGGSGAVRGRFVPLRQVGATAREMLISAAAKKWNVSVDDCKAEKGTVVHKSSGKIATYGELASIAATLEVPQNPKLKDPKQFKYLGTRIKDVDGKAIITGQPLYGIDTRKEGMLFAMVARPPAHGKTLESFNDEEALKIEGVKKVVKLDNSVAVLASSTWAAKKGRDALIVNWIATDKLENTSDHIKDFEEILKSENDRHSRNDGDFDAVKAKATNVLDATYLVQTLSHGQMEPLNFYADVREDKVDLYGPTQVPGRVRDDVASKLGIPRENISVGMPRQGGGFGRKLMNDNAMEATLISQAAKCPVQVQWTREDDMQNDFYRPLSMFRYQGAISNEELLGWNQFSVGIGGGGVRGDSYLAGALENYRSGGRGYSSNTPTGWWRAPGANALAFPAESFIDEVCVALKKDPVDFRIEIFEKAKTNPVGRVSYDPEKYLSVVNLVAEMSEWKTPRAEIYRGFATWFSFGSYAAQVVDVILDNDGKPRISKVYCAVNCGTVINLSGAENQVQGAIVDGICHAMFPKITFVEGSVKETNFDAYKFLRMNDAPLDIEVKFVDSEEAPSGLGEPALPPIAAALANALYAATGKRIRKMPLMDYFDA